MRPAEAVIVSTLGLCPQLSYGTPTRIRGRGFRLVTFLRKRDEDGGFTGKTLAELWVSRPEEIVEKFGSGCGSIGFVDVENVSGLSQLRFMAGLRAMKIDSE
ncbi:hypothetical protein AXG93_4689s1700 [Marchantia polymorpha subsp. ruderalis]|uniref:Uncharacterized protein n=1 Tax=Marchantia polymorpha subsp. ruderalis TaxID=1480154 RepID=A0A176WM37_MARPO|nr:hypothetical protein AXG93_4689s1700 [Marchantia polymorpha subsp. ruderalis]